MIALIVLAIALATAACTWLMGWWGVLLVPFVAGLVWRRHASARLAAYGAALGWALLLVGDATAGRLGATGAALGGVLRVPGPVLVLVTLLFAMAGGWSAAAVAAELVRGHTAA